MSVHRDSAQVKSGVNARKRSAVMRRCRTSFSVMGRIANTRAHWPVSGRVGSITTPPRIGKTKGSVLVFRPFRQGHGILGQRTPLCLGLNGRWYPRLAGAAALRIVRLPAPILIVAKCMSRARRNNPVEQAGRGSCRRQPGHTQPRPWASLANRSAMAMRRGT